MNKEEIIQFINANPACYLATIDDGRPRVRGMLMYRADSEGILFHTGGTKDLFRQILKDPHAEACFTSPDGGIQVRVSGTVKVIEDMELKRE
ncbi:pyridoxamine 5'-phosphate oxidase family protein, partial [archaeon]|nr:pyridoxamine 5'-phosphate oxidase family protein [archaeon]